jgi:hypothetical protein
MPEKPPPAFVEREIAAQRGPTAMPNYREAIAALYDLSGEKSITAFARRCGKTPQNMANYLNGNIAVGKRVTQEWIKKVFTPAQPPSPSFTPLLEVIKVPSQSATPEKSGVYVIYDSGAQVLYVGQAKNFRSEVYQTLERKIPTSLRLGATLKKARPKLRDLAAYLSLYEIEDARLRHNMEALLLRVFVNQTHNSNIGHFRA